MSVLGIGQAPTTSTQSAPKAAAGGGSGASGAVQPVRNTVSTGRVAPVTGAQPLNSSGRGQKLNILA